MAKKKAPTKFSSHQYRELGEYIARFKELKLITEESILDLGETIYIDGKMYFKDTYHSALVQHVISNLSGIDASPTITYCPKDILISIENDYDTWEEIIPLKGSWTEDTLECIFKLVTTIIKDGYVNNGTELMYPDDDY